MQRRHGARDAGAVAIEFALLMAFMPLPFLAFGIVDYGEFMAQTTNLAAVVRGAAEYARGQVVLPTPSEIGSALNVPSAVFSISSFCTCANNIPVTCQSASCAGPDPRVLKYIAVSASQTYTPLISGSWSFPGSVNAWTVLRTQ